MRLSITRGSDTQQSSRARARMRTPGRRSINATDWIRIVAMRLSRNAFTTIELGIALTDSFPPSPSEPYPNVTSRDDGTAGWDPERREPRASPSDTTRTLSRCLDDVPRISFVRKTNVLDFTRSQGQPYL